MRVLAVGGGGLIGSRLVPALRAAGHDVTATVRGAPEPGEEVLDLAGGDWPEVTADAVVISAAVTARAACEADPAGSFAVNVEAPVRLARPVLAAGGQVVFLSTHIVLGGARPFLEPDAPYDPCDAYSAHKAEAERRLLALPGAAEGLTILRLPRVLGRGAGLVGVWERALAAGGTIEAYTDQVMAPVSVGHVVGEIAAILTDRLTGIRHVSGAAEISNANVAGRLGAALGWNPARIRRIEGRPVNPVIARTPPHASLACDRPQALDDVLTDLVAEGGAPPP